MPRSKCPVGAVRSTFAAANEVQLPSSGSYLCRQTLEKDAVFDPYPAVILPFPQAARISADCDTGPYASAGLALGEHGSVDVDTGGIMDGNSNTTIPLSIGLNFGKLVEHMYASPELILGSLQCKYANVGDSEVAPTAVIMASSNAQSVNGDTISGDDYMSGLGVLRPSSSSEQKTSYSEVSESPTIPSTVFRHSAQTYYSYINLSEGTWLLAVPVGPGRRDSRHPSSARPVATSTGSRDGMVTGRVPVMTVRRMTAVDGSTGWAGQG
ncbi:hypothetical protein GGX14DRAFT_395707 [Mycena pura]|uniref:Uncharacterized protein n=1 Tax=Mycena pura TaxID=153505 RepID=A0AAD6Y9E7_9AGAR|nr:hypothetical protein GGX14DRAFT_395707 [Mycena pura]